MTTIKARKQGNSIIVTIPKSLGVEDGEEFYVIKKENGAITMIPKVENPFRKAEDGEFHTPDLNMDYLPHGEELNNI